MFFSAKQNVNGKKSTVVGQSFITVEYYGFDIFLKTQMSVANTALQTGPCIISIIWIGSTAVIVL